MLALDRLDHLVVPPSHERTTRLFYHDHLPRVFSTKKTYRNDKHNPTSFESSSQLKYSIPKAGP